MRDHLILTRQTTFKEAGLANCWQGVYQWKLLHTAEWSINWCKDFLKVCTPFLQHLHDPGELLLVIYLEKLFYVNTRRHAKIFIVHNYKKLETCQICTTGKQINIFCYIHIMDWIQLHIHTHTRMVWETVLVKTALFSAWYHFHEIQAQKQSSILFRDTYMKTFYKGNETQLRRAVGPKVWGRGYDREKHSGQQHLS